VIWESPRPRRIAENPGQAQRRPIHANPDPAYPESGLINAVIGTDYKVSERLVLGVMGTYEIPT
jgi:hypothetical protein